MHPHAFNCPMCGAAARSESTRCQHCGARLATVACPSCFGMMFLGTKFCPRCGAEASRTELAPSDRRSWPCPRCTQPLNAIAVGATSIHECTQCEGLWVTKDAFEKLCADNEKQSAVLGRAAIAGNASPQAPAEIRYVPCPDCRKLMNRVNFANCSGVIIDVCRNHGTWFDRDELARIIEFIRSGGIEISRDRQRAELAQDEQRLRRLRAAALNRPENDPELRTSAVIAASDLLAKLLR